MTNPILLKHQCITISPGKAIAETALTKLKASFSSLLMDVQSSMEGRKVEVKKVRRFMLGFFCGECSIPKDGRAGCKIST